MIFRLMNIVEIFDLMQKNNIIAQDKQLQATLYCSATATTLTGPVATLLSAESQTGDMNSHLNRNSLPFS